MLEALAALVVATTSLLGSPGPATISLAAVGATSGIRNGLPYLLGILAGLFCVLIASVIGLATVLTRWPSAGMAIQVVGSIYILYVAWKIGSAPVTVANAGQADRHPGFRDGFILNLLNAKAYAVFFALFTQLRLPFDSAALAYTSTAAVVFTVGIVVDIAWLLAGGSLQALFSRPKSARILRVTFALLVVASVVWMLWSAGLAND